MTTEMVLRLTHLQVRTLGNMQDELACPDPPAGD